MLTFAIVGYLSPLDFGLGRATTKAVAAALSQKRDDVLATAFWTSVIFLLGIGLLGSVALALISPFLATKVFAIPPKLHAEALLSFRYAAASVPLVVMAGAVRGALEAAGAFGVTNSLAVISGCARYLLPLIVVEWGGSVADAILCLCVASALTVLAHIAFLVRMFPTVRTPSFSTKQLREQLHFGIWASVSNGAAVAASYLDRFLLGSLDSLAAVAYYSVPRDVITRTSIFPNSLSTTLFPLFSTGNPSDQKAVSLTHARAVKFLVAATIIPAASLVVFAEQLLRLWLGRNLSYESVLVLQILALGGVINSVGYPSFALLQGRGRPDVVAKLFVLELPAYAGMIAGLVHWYGAVGAAVACSIRWAFEVFWYWRSMCRLASEVVNASKAGLARGTLGAAFLALSAVAVLLIAPATLASRVGLFGLAEVAYGVCAWRWVLSEEEREWAATLFATLRGRFRL